MTDPAWTDAQNVHRADGLLVAWQAELLGEDLRVTSILGQLPAAVAAWLFARDAVLVARSRVALGHYDDADLADREASLALARQHLDRLLAQHHATTTDDLNDRDHEESR